MTEYTTNHEGGQLLEHLKDFIDAMIKLEITNKLDELDDNMSASSLYMIARALELIQDEERPITRKEMEILPIITPWDTLHEYLTSRTRNNEAYNRVREWIGSAFTDEILDIIVGDLEDKKISDANLKLRPYNGRGDYKLAFDEKIHELIQSLHPMPTYEKELSPGQINDILWGVVMASNHNTEISFFHETTG